VGLGPCTLENMAITGAMADPTFWGGKTVLLTGHSGFKGAWLAFWLSRLGAKVTGLSLLPATAPNLFSLLRLQELVDSRWVDVRDLPKVGDVFREVEPDIVFHLAAQALVRPGYKDPPTTFTTNFNGTLSVLENARHSPTVKSVVIVTTDKVYRNSGRGRPFREDDTLGGHDPYSASKAAAEMLISCYRNAFYQLSGIGLAAARAGNVIGGGDWSEDRILPDAVRAWGAGVTLEVRNPESTRPWQHVLEPLSGYLSLAERLFHDPSASSDFNFGPDPGDNTTVRDVVEIAREAFGRGEVAWGIRRDALHEAEALALDSKKAKEVLGVAPVWNLKVSVERTMRWYRQQLEGKDARMLCEEDIEAIVSSA
jgi:CDP-glucose 4,6-dehydratase